MRSAGWSLFLACSWTWCIGMYLPVIAMREYGWPGLVIFTVPNVIGCAAFGYILRNGDASRRFIRQHGGAATAFSTVTIAFHLFFIPMLLLMWFGQTSLGHPAAIPILISLAVFSAGLALARLSSRAWLWLAALLYSTSLLLLLATLATGAFRFQIDPPLFSARNLPWLAIASVFGFALCPYLDLTFHRALRESRNRDVFLGFGIAFAVMIVFTAVFAVTGFDAVILAHILAQATFTVGAHLRELRERRSAAGGRLLLVVPLVGAPLALLPFVDGEVTYQGFMTAYGLIFPAYVWIFATRRPLMRLGTRNVLIWAALTAASIPALYVAFIAHIAWPVAIPFGALAVWTTVVWVRHSGAGEARPVAEVADTVL
ncbi:MAG: hypothetical protein KAS72_04050 [Phycisphaerales bacterium]|nr:hypothetical protein [Phycisphaerales bacterium]